MGNDQIVAMAEAICREHDRRHRDITNAIDDFRSADSDDRRVRMAGDLMNTVRMAEHRFIHNMSDESIRCIEKMTGKTMDELMQEGLAAFGIGFGPDGQPQLVGTDENDDQIEVEMIEEPVASGDGNAIDGIDMSSLDIDFNAIEREFRQEGGGV